MPALGERWAELLELPVMVTVSYLAARWVVRRFGLGAGWRRPLAVGLCALALLLFAELMVVLFVQRLSLGEYIAGRDPISGGFYLLSLALFPLMPWLAALRGRRAGAEAEGALPS